ncbi:podoplanin [Bubalus kerabau]|uniref:podoplanin n=1 Tax=Bubalus bubalis TaxID=89462 RepID=UPI001E1B84C9|nr:podoplanin [Bubalus bubalis]XP_055438625.1 podoplanin [Bubalus carabanensis]
MWKVPVLFFILGSASFWVLAEGASTVRPEDDVTTGVTNEKTTLGVEDYTTTPAASKESLATPMPAGTKNVTHGHREDLPTAESTTAKSTPARSTTAKSTPARSTTAKSTPAKTTVHTHVSATSHSQGKTDGEKPKSTQKGGLSVGTLVGIIVGVLLGIAVFGGIISVIVRKMGRYSP